MTLKECTKEELIFVIERLQLCAFSSGTYHVNMALSEVESQRAERKYMKAKELSDYSAQKRQEYITLMKPYEGKPFLDIPDSVLNQAVAALKEAEEADRKWQKLMGVHGEKKGEKT